MSMVIWEELERKGCDCFCITVAELHGRTEKDIQMVGPVVAIF
jgi:hypothetical protein